MTSSPHNVNLMTRFDLAIFVLRLFFGLSMTYHGLNKVRGSGLQGTANWFASIGMRHPRSQAKLAATSEIVAGLLFAVGLATSLASLMFVSLMVVAIFTVHWKVGFFIFLPNGGWEYCASILVVATSTSIMGPGQISIDHLIGLSNELGLLSFPLGFAFAMCHLALWYRPKKLSMTS